jgi:hypothetical protein
VPVRQQASPERGLVLEPVERTREVCRHPGRHGIEALGPVEGEEQDMLVGDGQLELVGERGRGERRDHAGQLSEGQGRRRSLGKSPSGDAHSRRVAFRSVNLRTDPTMT